MLLDQSLRADHLNVGTFALESFNSRKLLEIVTNAVSGSQIFGPDAAADFFVENEGSGASDFVMRTLVAKIEFIANSFVGMGEQTVGPFAADVDVRTGFLDEDTIAAIDVVRQNASVVIRFGNVEDETVVTQTRRGLTIHTFVIQIALLGIREKSVLFRTFEVVDLRTGELEVVLSANNDGR